LTIHGATSEDQVLALFDTIVPSKRRGLLKQDLLECAGGCALFKKYENVEFSSWVVGHQKAEPAAIIAFCRNECKPVLSQTSKVVVNIQKY
jgi:hypothetical protein